MQAKKLNCILLVDDDPTTNFLNKRLLAKMEVVDHIKEARNGIEALKYLRQTETEPEGCPMPDLILLDLNMPMMDGWEFLDAYQQLPEHLRRSLVIVMLTTSLREEDQVRANRISDVRTLIHKPLNREMMSEVLSTYFQLSDRP